MNENLKKGLQKVAIGATKVGIFAYDKITDEISSQARKMRNLEQTQIRKNYVNMSDEELIQVGKNSEGSRKMAIRKELLERQSDKAYYNMSRLAEYDTYDDTDRRGAYISEDGSITIYVTECTDVRMEFILISERLKKKNRINCTGKFLGYNKVLYTGNHFTISIDWNDEEDNFELSGKIPWEEEKVYMTFEREDVFEDGETSENEVT